MAKSQPSETPSTGMIEPGQAAPDFALEDQKGHVHTLKGFRGQWVVLYFYPKDDTPGCTVEACRFRDATPEFTKRGAVVLGVSPDSAKSHDKFVGKFNLPFALLADTEKKACQAYGVWQEKSMYGRKYMGVARTTYLIDPKGKVAARWDKVKPAEHDSEVLAKMDELKKP
jgi:peroxiredoxin Q/BCP